MVRSRALTFSKSSSTLRCPLCEKKVSTIRSRWRVVLRPRAAIHAESRSRAVAAADLREGARVILILILSLDRRYLRNRTERVKTFCDVDEHVHRHVSWTRECVAVRA